MSTLDSGLIRSRIKPSLADREEFGRLISGTRLLERSASASCIERCLRKEKRLKDPKEDVEYDGRNAR